MRTKYLLSIYDDEQTLMEAVPHIKSTGTSIYEVYSPFPIHGIDELLGYKRSRLPIAAFLFGVTGFSLGLLMQSYMLGFSKWRINIGGKPYLAWPDFVPVTFEITVLVTALGMVATYLLACKFFPGAPNLQPDLRVTNDRFVIAMKHNEVSQTMGDVSAFLKQHGAIEVREENIEL